MEDNSWQMKWELAHRGIFGDSSGAICSRWRISTTSSTPRSWKHRLTSSGFRKT